MSKQQTIVELEEGATDNAYPALLKALTNVTTQAYYVVVQNPDGTFTMGGRLGRDLVNTVLNDLRPISARIEEDHANEIEQRIAEWKAKLIEEEGDTFSPEQFEVAADMIRQHEGVKSSNENIPPVLKLLIDMSLAMLHPGKENEAGVDELIAGFESTTKGHPAQEKFKLLNQELKKQLMDKLNKQ